MLYVYIYIYIMYLYILYIYMCVWCVWYHDISHILYRFHILPRLGPLRTKARL